MEILLKKQPQKYLKKLDEKTRAKLYAALDEVSELITVSINFLSLFN